MFRTILMGQTGVVSNKEAQETQLGFLKSPAAQTCIILALTSPNVKGIAHFDTPFYVDAAIKNMLSKFKKLGEKPQDIQATLVGGDKGLTLINSSSIYNAVTASLIKEGMPKNNIKHNDYTYGVSYLLLPVSYFALRTLDLVGPESNWSATAFALGLLGATVALNSYFLEKEFDVEINIKTGEIGVTPTNPAKLQSIIEEGTTLKQREAVRLRFNLSPHKSSPAHVYESIELTEKHTGLRK